MLIVEKLVVIFCFNFLLKVEEGRKQEWSEWGVLESLQVVVFDGGDFILFLSRRRNKQVGKFGIQEFFSVDSKEQDGLECGDIIFFL